MNFCFFNSSQALLLISTAEKLFNLGSKVLIAFKFNPILEPSSITLFILLVFSNTLEKILDFEANKSSS